MSRSSFSRLDRVFHWLALQPRPVRELSFDLDRSFALPRKSPAQPPTPGPADEAVYVCGLARSGTTMLLRVLDQIEVFRSLSYRDMPFVLAPNIWRQVVGDAPSSHGTAERAHGDGIQVDVDSPESFEQVFWRTFTRRLRDPRCFGSEPPSARVMASFADYRALVANPAAGPRASATRRRYLSKNNNNMLRLDALCTDPTASVLLAYRDPVATARSLFQQHQRFCAMQADDPFVGRYMAWLEHYEFGPGHLPFCFAVPRMNPALRPDDPNYWLDYWCAVYAEVIDSRDPQIHLVGHDALRANPSMMLDAVCRALGVNADVPALAAQIAPPVAMKDNRSVYRTDLLDSADALHEALLASPLNIDSTLQRDEVR